MKGKPMKVALYKKWTIKRGGSGRWYAYMYDTDVFLCARSLPDIRFKIRSYEAAEQHMQP
jgi:hypothetical protein